MRAVSAKRAISSTMSSPVRARGDARLVAVQLDVTDVHGGSQKNR
jgi:hypothetical protein